MFKSKLAAAVAETTGDDTSDGTSVIVSGGGIVRSLRTVSDGKRARLFDFGREMTRQRD